LLPVLEVKAFAAHFKYILMETNSFSDRILHQPNSAIEPSQLIRQSFDGGEVDIDSYVSNQIEIIWGLDNVFPDSAGYSVAQKALF